MTETRSVRGVMATECAPAFAPDSDTVAEVTPSPNHEERVDCAHPDFLLLHYTGMPDAERALAWLCAAESKVSTHYFVFEDGRIVQSVPEARRAWHAGVSSWAGERDINSRSIGIEIANPGHDFGYPDFPAQQVDAVIALCRDIIARCAIPANRVLAHSDVAPNRKRDPGEKFPWRLLHAHGIGRWVEPAPIAHGPALAVGDGGEEVAALQADLRRLGYGIEAAGAYDQLTADVVAAFQRHFRPERVDGAADSSTMATLRALLAQPGRSG